MFAIDLDRPSEQGVQSTATAQVCKFRLLKKSMLCASTQRAHAPPTLLRLWPLSSPERARVLLVLPHSLTLPHSTCSSLPNI
eukprot:496220-Pleurochrysis_carterae.AAC.1